MGHQKGTSKSGASVDKRSKSKTAAAAAANNNNNSGTSKSTSSSSSKGSTGNMKMTLCTASGFSATTKIPRERKTSRTGGKRALTGKARAAARQSVDPCDNSNDSGLGFENHMEQLHTMRIANRQTWLDDRQDVKKMRLDVKLENEEVNENYGFPEGVRTCDSNISLIRTAPIASTPSVTRNGTTNSSTGGSISRCQPVLSRKAPTGPITLTSQLLNTSRRDNVQLQIVSQPEQQHRARYQTEGSRGAVKDRSGNGFPIVQLNGYNKPTTLQVFIGTDMGKVAPHMFYQACRVSGKNSTPCIEKKIDGTVVIEIQLDPSKEMVATCDCVGILKERNVDVEHRFPDQLGSRSKKKSTRCRMVFRTVIAHDDGFQETLQVCSHPIVCTQPPGIPEISKKSLTGSPASGGLELFVLGKNFLKDTRVLFRQTDDDHKVIWEQNVAPDKEFLQPTHFVCVVPPYVRPDITEPVTVRLYVVSSGKTSEPHSFTYTPTSGATSTVCVAEPTPTPTAAPFLSKMLWQSGNSKQEQDVDMMPPPTSLIPIRRPSTSMMADNSQSPPMRTLKTEIMMDENSQNSVFDPMDIRTERFHPLNESSLDVHQGDSNMTMINENTIDLLRSDLANKIMENSSSQMGMVDGDILGECKTSDGSAEMPIGATNFAASLLRTVLPQQNELPSQLITPKELMVMDLRVKNPIGTVADLANTNSPSMATLHRFGVTEPTSAPLPNQSAQSIENYLTNLEKPAPVPQVAQVPNMFPIMPQTETTAKLDDFVNSTAENHITANATASQNTLITKQSPIIPNQPDILVAATQSALISNVPAPLTSTLSAADVLLPNTQGLQPPQILNTNAIVPTVTSTVVSPDVILNTQVSPSMICPAPSLDPSHMLQPQLPITQDNSLVSLLSPSLANSAPLPNIANPAEVLLSSPTPTVSERSIILNAAADLLATQEKINALDTLTNTTATVAFNQHINFLTNSTAADVLHQNTTVTGTFMEQPAFCATSAVVSPAKSLIASKSIIDQESAKNMLTVPAAVNDIVNGTAPVVATVVDQQTASNIIAGTEVKKNDDAIIPPVFATMPTMSENDLIDMINPSCFDQGQKN